jgi:signal transduction histidine kinase
LINIEVSTSDDYAIIIIKDHGIGISNDVLPKIYTMFYRGTEQSHGSGLGLYIVKEIVLKLKGRIVITSVPGESTTVTITIPNKRLHRDTHLPSPRLKVTGQHSRIKN